VILRRRRRLAGRSALARWRELRRQRLRRDWKDVAVFLLVVAGSLIGIGILEGAAELTMAALLGAACTMAIVWWMLAGDVHTLPWVWGAIGEQQTEEALAQLDDAWTVVHDVQRERANFDHIVVGPPGVFLLDTKRLHGAAVAGGDALRSGKGRWEGRAFRGAAVALGHALEPALGRRPWVTAVVVVWDDFPQGRHEENHVVYIAGGELAAWLTALPPKLPPSTRQTIARAVVGLTEQSA
jgi:hypothetical protein